jgi:hypothetical protein
MAIVHVLMRSVGEYSDREVYCVRAFKSEEQAKSFLTACDSRRSELGDSKNYLGGRIRPGQNQFDPDFEGWSEEISYYLDTCEMAES